MFNRCRSELTTLPGAGTVEETAVTGEECDAKRIGKSKEVQEIEQEIPSANQMRANELIIPERKTTLSNVDYVASKEVIGQKTALIVLLW